MLITKEEPCLGNMSRCAYDAFRRCLIGVVAHDLHMVQRIKTVASRHSYSGTRAFRCPEKGRMRVCWPSRCVICTFKCEVAREVVMVLMNSVRGLICSRNTWIVQAWPPTRNKHMSAPNTASGAENTIHHGNGSLMKIEISFREVRARVLATFGIASKCVCKYRTIFQLHTPGGSCFQTRTQGERSVFHHDHTVLHAIAGATPCSMRY